MGDFLDAVQGSDVIQGVNAWWESTVKAEDLVLDQGGQGKEVKEVGKVLPNVGIAILSETLIVKSIDLGDLARFVVSTENCDALGVSDLEGNKQSNGLYRVVATVDVVT
jgi:hypothetical protein